MDRPSSNSIWDGKRAYVPALEDVLVWDVKKGQMVAMWHETGHRAEVTAIARSPQLDQFAVGYADGSIRHWSAASGSVSVTLNGHKNSVTALAFDSTGSKLASGSQDTSIIMWDVIGESGLYRLRGHRDQITSLKFVVATSDLEASTSSSSTARTEYLLSTSKDTFLKLWELSSQHCVQTIVAHRSEVWTMDVDVSRRLVFTGSSDGDLRVWKLDYDAMVAGLQENDTGDLNKMLTNIGTIPLAAKHRVSQILFHPTQPFFGVQSHDRSIELFRIRTEEEIKKKQARRRKREKEKAKQAKADAMEVDEPNDNIENEPHIIETMTPFLVCRASGKIRSMDFCVDAKAGAKSFQLFLGLASNAMEVYNIPLPSSVPKGQIPEATRAFSLDLPGHRTDVRTLCLSSDDELLASASNGMLKVWNMKTNACIRTLECGTAVCSTFLPGDRHIAVGTKVGEILLYDISASILLQTVIAHEGTLWSMHMRYDNQTLVTGSADKDVKFWNLSLETTEPTEFAPNGSRMLNLVHTKTLKMTDEILSVRFSPNGKLLAVSLLDSTVKVFYHDTLKFFLSLYGHKLPVLCMDISHDSKLIVTCSADKNVKIWGLDFGDCHKSIFAHEESIMQVAFEHASHYFWTVGKDKMVKYWDGDKFELIQKLEGHHGEVWALTVSHWGKFIVTGSHDKSIRVWEKLDEPLFLEEERERELEAIYDRGMVDTLNDTERAIGSGVDGAQTAEGPESGAVAKQTTETLMAGERIMEALEVADTDRGMVAASGGNEADAQRHPVLAALGIGSAMHVLRVVEKIQAAALHDALLVLPFGKVTSLMYYLSEWASHEWNIPLVSRILFFLLKTHHHQIVASRTLRSTLIPLRSNLRQALMKQKQTMAYNLAGLKYLQREDAARREAKFLEETHGDILSIRKRIEDAAEKKRKRVTI